MADTIAKVITNKKVKETIARAQSMQESALSQIKELAGKVGGITSGISNVLTNAQNVISNTVSGIAGNIMASVEAFANKINAGITTTLTDLSKKAGSIISDLVGKTGLGAVAEKLSYVVNTVNATINSVSAVVGDVASTISNFTSGQLAKLAAATGISKILNNSDVFNAVSSVANSFSSMTSAAKSIVGSVLAMPGAIVSAATGLVDSTVGAVTGAVGGIISSVANSVSSLAKVPGIGDLSTLVKDTYELYSMGRSVYDTVTGKDNSMLVGIASQLNNSFPNVQNILNAASTICKTLNSKSIQNYSANKDLMDLLLSRMANQGMYGAIQSLLNCSDTQQYIDDTTYNVLAKKFTTAVNNGDVYTAYTIQNTVGNSRLSNVQSNMYTLAKNIPDDDATARATYMQLLNKTNTSVNQMFGSNLTNNNGSTMYTYSAQNISNFKKSKPNLFKDLMGDTPLADIATALVQNI